MKRKKSSKYSKKIKKQKRQILKITYVIIIVISLISIIYYFYNLYNNEENLLKNIEIDTSKIINENTERMLQLEQLKKKNEDIIGWIEIPNTKINYPVMQCADNDYYMKHTYNKKYSNNGSIFLDKKYDWNLPSSNLLLYGHNNNNGKMFQELLEYKEESYYKEHPTIRFTTLDEDCEYEIISTFLSRVYYKNETGVFRYYYFINAEDEKDYDEFIENCKNASLYDTGKTATYGEQLLTLSTCEYSQEDGRFAVVAKKIDK